MQIKIRTKNSGGKISNKMFFVKDFVLTHENDLLMVFGPISIRYIGMRFYKNIRFSESSKMA